MDIRRPLYILALILLVAALAPHAGAQDTYSWQVNYQHVILDIDRQGYVDMQYEIDANIQQGVWNEVWIPETKSNMKVSKVVDGAGAQHDFYIDGGQIKIKGFNLQPGDHVNLKIYATLYEFVYTADKPGYVIATFIPDWWDMDIKDTQVKYYLPGNVPKDQVFTGQKLYDNFGVEDNRTWVYFQSTGLSPNEQFQTAVSFPDSQMDPSVLAPAATTDYYSSSSSSSSPVGSCCGCLICLAPFLIIFTLLFLVSRMRMPYSSPAVGMAGLSVNKDLDPVEAATLLRIDPRRILTMIMFGLMKKGNVELDSTNPVQLRLVSGQGLNYYEKLFAASIVDDKLDEGRLLECFKVLARTVVDKTRPFSRKDTEDYYQTKIQESWDQIKAVDTPELKLEKYDANMFWLMADEQFTQKTTDYVAKTPGSGTVIVPSTYWWYPYYIGTPHHYSGGPAPVTTPTGATYGPPTGGVPVGGKAPAAGSTNATTSSIESFANSISNSVESMSAGVVGGVERFAGVRDAANAPPPAASRPAPGPSTFAGRSSCACAHCACACAHCACACACAGGGHGCT